MWRVGIGYLALVVWLALMCAPAWATVVGLNQIATPDIQPKGLLAISGQFESSAIGNPEQLQLELGLTDAFEVAVFQGFSPAKTVFNAELALVQRKCFLTSVGLLGTQAATKYQPFVESAYYAGNAEIIAGIQRQAGLYYGVFGLAYQTMPRLRLATDYVSGPGNFATVGATYTITPSLSFNSALYISNASPNNMFGYGVLTWEVKIW